MKNIFIGFIFALLDFDLDIGRASIGLIPDFIGYILILNGFKEMSQHSSFFSMAIPRVQGMAVLSTVAYLIDLFGADLGIISTLIGLAGTILSIYIAYDTVKGIQDTERIYSINLNGQALRSAWNVWKVCTILSYILLVTLLFAIFSPIAAFISFIASVCFLVALNKSRNLYYERFGFYI